MPKSITLLDANAVPDLKVYLARLQNAQVDRVLVQVVRHGGGVSAVFAGALLAPESLLDKTPTVLAEKAYRVRVDADAAESGPGLGQPQPPQPSQSQSQPSQPPPPQPELVVNEVYPLAALNERLAHLQRTGANVMQLPPAATTASWAGVTAPLGGWQAEGQIAASSLQQVAQQGATRIAAALPTAPGQAIVNSLRAEVWGAPMLPGVPAGAAFALAHLGFLEGAENARLLRHGNWVRITTSRGSAVVRQGL